MGTTTKTVEGSTRLERAIRSVLAGQLSGGVDPIGLPHCDNCEEIVLAIITRHGLDWIHTDGMFSCVNGDRSGTVAHYCTHDYHCAGE